MTRRRPGKVAPLLLLLALAGCARALPPPRQAIPADAGRALALLAGRWQAFSDLRTLADLDVSRGGERQQLLAVVLARAPASVRVEALSPLGQPLLLMTIHDGRLVAYDAAANEALVGPATADTTARLLGLPFEPDDLVGVLAARPVPPRDVRLAQVLPPDDDGPSLLVVGTVHQQQIWMDFATGVVRQVELTGGLYEVRVTYEYAPDGRLQGLTFRAPRRRVTGALRYRDPVVDAGIDPGRFQLTLPDTAKIQPLR